MPKQRPLSSKSGKDGESDAATPLSKFKSLTKSILTVSNETVKGLEKREKIDNKRRDRLAGAVKRPPKRG